MSNSCIDIFWDYFTSIQKTASHVFTMSKIENIFKMYQNFLISLSQPQWTSQMTALCLARVRIPLVLSQWLSRFNSWYNAPINFGALNIKHSCLVLYPKQSPRQICKIRTPAIEIALITKIHFVWEKDILRNWEMNNLPWVTFYHLVFWLKTCGCNFLHRKIFMTSFSRTYNGCICSQWEMNSRIWNQVSLKFVQINVESSIKSEGCFINDQKQ
jgi:hypothetical protein